MTEIAYVEIDPDFEPLSRPRSCTWPLPRPEFDEPTSSNTSSPAPSVKHEPGVNTDLSSNINLLAQTEDYAEQKTPVTCNDFQCQETCVHLHSHGRPHNPPLPTPGLTLPHQQQVAPGVNSLTTAQRKTSSSRRNAWGNMSYADLITKAIDSSPEKRLTLSQIYDWMVKSVPYFKDKGDSNSSAGWKNSIRHNLSLHSRFVRMQNEGTGKSSWWMLNPDGGKNGKSPRRRAASMDNNSKFTKSRGRAARKKVTLQEGMEHTAGSPGSQYTKWLGSPNSHSNDDFETWSSFRTRTSSDASTLSGRHSPFLSEQDDLTEADVHMGYSGGPGAKITGTLPSLSEVGGSMGQRGPENLMENLLDNLNLLSPKNPQRRSDSPNSSTPSLLRSSPYSHPSMAHQQDYSKCLYGQQQQMSSVSPVPMRTVPDGKPGYGSFETHYSRPPGLLDDLLASGGDLHGDMMAAAAAAAAARAGRGQCLPPSYGSHGHHVDHMCAQVMSRHVPTSSSQAPNGCGMVPLTSLARTPHHMNSLRTGMQMLQGHQTHPRARAPPSYGSLSGSRHPPHPYHSHHHERLPSDLDNVSIEGFECDMESVLHDTLMDGDALDFNFDPTAGLHGFPQRLKPNNHSWVSS